MRMAQRDCVKRGQVPLCEAPCWPFRQRYLTPFHTLSVVATLLCFAGPGAAPGSQKQPGGEAELAFLDRFPGEWSVQAKWATGESLEARGVYEWSLGKRILVTKTFVKDGAKEYQRYEGIMTWHPEKKTLYQVSFAYDGNITETVIDLKDKDTMQVGFTPFVEGKPSNVRQVIRFLNNDQFQWTVSINDGKQWQQIMDATWKRKRK
jgi:hypothetical protein